MIERTPQEIADFWQCYVAMDRNGKWNIYENRLAIEDGMSFWFADSGFDVEINKGLIEVPANHDWTILYKPGNITPESGNINSKSGENCQKSDLYPHLPVANDSGISSEAYYPDFKDSGSKDSAPHQSQVHTHQEYIVAEAKRAEDLAKKVNVMLDHGWKPQGGIAIEYLPESDGYAEGSEIFYQALTRGLS